MGVIEQPVPQSFLDAGGELSAVLSGSIHRCLDALEYGQILEVISTDQRSCLDIATWCALTGHHLLQIECRNDEILFQIRK